MNNYLKLIENLSMIIKLKKSYCMAFAYIFSRNVDVVFWFPENIVTPIVLA